MYNITDILIHNCSRGSILFYVCFILYRMVFLFTVANFHINNIFVDCSISILKAIQN